MQLMISSAERLILTYRRIVLYAWVHLDSGEGSAVLCLRKSVKNGRQFLRSQDNLKYSMHLILTDTEGGLLVVCGARNHLGFDKRGVTVDGKPLKEVVKEHEL